MLARQPGGRMAWMRFVVQEADKAGLGERVRACSRWRWPEAGRGGGSPLHWRVAGKNARGFEESAYQVKTGGWLARTE